MNLDIYSTLNSSNNTEEITKITLTNDEWLIFLKNLSDSGAINIELNNNKIGSRDIEWIDINRCVPLCNNCDFVRRYEADTRLVSIISENYGETPLRLWFAERNISTTLNKTLEEIFPGLLPEEVLFNFWDWWNKMPLDSKPVGKFLVTKREEAFGAGHISAWILDGLKLPEPKIAWQKFLYFIKPWMYAYELIVKWSESNYISNNNGRIMPANLRLQK